MQVIVGKCPSKSNSYKIITINGHASLAKKTALKQYERSFHLQCNKYRNRMISVPFGLYIAVYYEDNRPDLDNSLKIVLDCLQACKAIKNDRQCVKIFAERFVDKKNPRIEIELTELEGIPSPLYPIWQRIINRISKIIKP